MLLTPFRVRLADEGTKLGYKPGYIGTVVGEDLAEGPEGKAVKVYLVLWYRVDEETGEESLSKQPAPSSHTPLELRGHVDPDHWLTDEDEDEDTDDVDDDTTDHLVSP